jgi:small-conductance mechanosensitive channel
MKLYLASAPASKRPKKSLPRFALNWLQRANADMQRASVTNQKEQARSDQLSASSEEIRQQAESKRDQMATRSEEEIRQQAASRREQMSKQIKALAAAKTDRRPA